MQSSDNAAENSIIRKNIFPTIQRIIIALENILNQPYVGNIMLILADMGVQFPEYQPPSQTEETSLKDKYIFLLKGAEFHDEEKPCNLISTSIREFLREIARDKPKIKTFLDEVRKYNEIKKHLDEQVLVKNKELKTEDDEVRQGTLQESINLLTDEFQTIPVPRLTEEIKWHMLTGVNNNYKQFRDMFLNLEDDIPPRREEGWMDDIYIDFLEQEMRNSKTLLQLENVRENFDYIKTLRDNVLKYCKEEGSLLNKEFILGIKEEIDSAQSIERVKTISRKYKQMKKMVPFIMHHPISFKDKNGNRMENTQQLKKSETFSEILIIAKATKNMIDIKKKKMKKALEEKESLGITDKIMGIIRG